MGLGWQEHEQATKHAGHKLLEQGGSKNEPLTCRKTSRPLPTPPDRNFGQNEPKPMDFVKNLKKI